MMCPKCKSDISEDSHFCSKCGTSLKDKADLSVSQTKTIQKPSISSGKTIAGKYKIIEEIGRGGMGVVYKAEDTRLKRIVALKFLPAELTQDKEVIKRFTQEAQAAASLDHPNICTVFEIDEVDGQTFIAMSFIDGQSLKEKLEAGPLDVDKAKDIVLQVAEGLKEAHDKGIVHRDIKPANIMLNEKGQAKITDFGLAKLSGGADLTKASTIMGTLAYMSPEQAKGEAVDHRTDIWSLGAIIYEMLAGERPFQKNQEQALIYAILNDKPTPLSLIRSDIPSQIEQTIEKTLAKKPSERHQNIQELIQALESPLSIDFPTPSCSIVVLPFDDMSPNRDNEYFSDGLTEEIITDLSQVRELCVISRNSAMALKGTKKNTKTIGKELNVQYLLEGSVRKAGQDLRITAQLIDARTDVHLWAEKYRGKLDDIFDIQEKVSKSIVEALKLTLSPGENQKILERPINNIQAYEYYLKARREIYTLTKPGLDNALQYLAKGLDIVGENVLLYASMGNVYYQYWNYGVWPDLSNIQKAKGCADRVFALEPDSRHGHFLQGLLQIFMKPIRAIWHFKRVLSEDPYHPEVLLWLSVYLVFQGQQKYAETFMERLVKVDSLNPIVKVLAGNLDLYCGRMEQALDKLKEVLEADPTHFVAKFHYAKALAYADRLEEAFAIIDDIEEQAGKMREHLFRLFKYAFQGNKTDLMDSVNQEFLAWARRDWMIALWLSEIYAMIDENKEALDWLDCAVSLGYINYPFLIKYNPLLKKIRGDTRFRTLIEDIRPKWKNFEI